MSNDNADRFELSRRKALAALGTIGAASAGAGLGTSAYFSDRETYEGNTLTAGSLDLKVDWEEHYSDWSDDE
ncbi:MAG: SipW-dependent-type signal peptide-containing protein, partial [Halobacteriaceae archaeon]